MAEEEDESVEDIRERFTSLIRDTEKGVPLLPKDINDKVEAIFLAHRLSRAAQCMFKTFVLEVGREHIRSNYGQVSLKEAVRQCSRDLVYEVFDPETKQITRFGRKIFTAAWLAVCLDREPTIDELLVIDTLNEAIRLTKGDPVHPKALVPDAYVDIVMLMAQTEYTDDAFTDDLVECSLPYASFIVSEKLEEAASRQAEEEGGGGQRD
jgi:hypothetical protein